MNPAPIHARGARRAWTALALAFYLAMLGWAAIPGQEQQVFGHTSDKLLHFGAYGVIACALYRGEPGMAWRRAVRTVALVALLGALDEAVQLLQAHRTPDWTDWVTDLLAGVTVSAAAVAGSARRRPRSGERCRT